jgi:hypothetical protein
VQLARKQIDPESDEFVTQGKRTDLEHRVNTAKSRNDERNTKPGILRRLARERPDLLDRVEVGELTANAAAVEAGFRRPMRSIPVDSAESAVNPPCCATSPASHPPPYTRRLFLYA